jgi:tetratricopeptide (TPR) repeat protein
VAAAEKGTPDAEDKMIVLMTNANQPPYWRAVAATLLERWAANPGTKAALLAELKNENPLVRERVVRALEPMLDDPDVQPALKPMLSDPLRNVRVAAAWELRATLDMRSQGGLDLQAMLDLEADQPTGQFEAAMLLLARQHPEEALTHLAKATTWDPLSPPFLCAQAEVQDKLGQIAAALQTLNRAAAAVPGDPHIPYVRAEILARNGRFDEARAAAKAALAIQPDFQPALELIQGRLSKH